MTKVDCVAAEQLRIVLGVSGSIAAYKSAEIVRLLRAEGMQVRAIMTAAAKRFIGVETLRMLTGNVVQDGIFLESGDWSDNHLSLADWAEVMLVAPATASTLARLACGMADDIVCCTALAMTPSRVLLAPAMNERMWLNPATVANMELLRSRGMKTVGPQEGELACGVSGQGRMADPAIIVSELMNRDEHRRSLEGRLIVVTAGPTREWLDDVRFISNPSTGLMGFALAEEAAACGAEVHLVLGPTASPLPPLPGSLKLYRVESADDMRRQVLQLAPVADALIMAAAVSDYRPKQRLAGKMKRTAPQMSLEMVANPDIIAEASKLAADAVRVGFALESDKAIENAGDKMKRKDLDLIVVNSPDSFAARRAVFSLLDRNGLLEGPSQLSKDELSAMVMKKIAALIAERKRN